MRAKYLRKCETRKTLDARGAPIICACAWILLVCLSPIEDYSQSRGYNAAVFVTQCPRDIDSTTSVFLASSGGTYLHLNPCSKCFAKKEFLKNRYTASSLKQKDKPTCFRKGANVFNFATTRRRIASVASIIWCHASPTFRAWHFLPQSSVAISTQHWLPLWIVACFANPVQSIL